MADWLIAATAAGMPGMVEEKPKYARATYTEQRYVVDETAEYSTAWDLPSVDDLEVAAAAAAAALDIFAPPPKAVSSDEESSDEDSDDDDGDAPMTDDHATSTTHTEVRIKLVEFKNAEAPDAECTLKLQLSYINIVTPGSSILAAATLAGARRFVRGSAAAAAAAACETQADSSPLASSDESSSSSDDDEEVTSGKGGPIMGLDEMRAMITKACEIVDEDEEGGGGGDGVKLGGMKEALGLPEITPLDVEVGLNDAIQPAGIVLSVMDGMIVLVGSANAPVLSEGSVLVLGDRTPIGRVEEVFGPVATPYYALRYAGAVGSAIPASIAPGSPMFSVLKFSTFISPDELVSSSTAAPARPIKVEGDNSDPDSDEEVYFSDDEKEAEYQKTQHSTKRRAAETPLGRGDGAMAGGGRGRGSRAGAPGSSQDRGGSSDRGRGGRHGSDRGRGGRGASSAAAGHSRPPYGSSDSHKRPITSEGHTMTSTYSQNPSRNHHSSGPPPSSTAAPASSPSTRQQPHPPSGPAPPSSSRQPAPPHPGQQQQPHPQQPPQYQPHPHPQQYPGYTAGPPGPWGPQYAMPPPGYGMPPPHGAYMYQHGPPPQGGGYPVNPNQPPPQYHPYQHPQYPQGQAPPFAPQQSYNPYGNPPPAGYPPQQQWPAPGPGGR